MNVLELKLPPVLVAMISALLMWLLATLTPRLPLDPEMTAWVAVLVALLGLVVAATGVSAFVQARTTLNPMQTAKSSALVTSGIYRVTRNPMYLGMLFVLLAWAVYLASAWALIGPLLFVAYMNRFQIRPEEQMLLSLFGEIYTRYMRRVRRWL